MPAKRAAKVTRIEPRRRRTAEEARRAILGAAKKRLAAGGPEAIRLQEIARDLGISHPAILHHFETRDGLMRALALSAVQSLDTELANAIDNPEATPGDVIDRVFAALGENGLARLLGWYVLSGFVPEPQEEEQYILGHLVAVLQERLRRERDEAEPPSLEETQFAVRLVGVALLGDTLFGHLVNTSLGTANAPDSQRRFRAWLAELLVKTLGAEDLVKRG